MVEQCACVDARKSIDKHAQIRATSAYLCQCGSALRQIICAHFTSRCVRRTGLRFFDRQATLPCSVAGERERERERAEKREKRDRVCVCVCVCEFVCLRSGNETEKTEKCGREQ